MAEPTSIDPKAYPLATDEQTQKILRVVQTMHDSNNLKIGANEVTKLLNKGKALIVILAADCEPFEITAHLPLICEDKNVPWVYIKGKVSLGKACDVQRPVVACAIFSDSEMSYNRIEKIVKDIIININS